MHNPGSSPRGWDKKGQAIGSSNQGGNTDASRGVWPFCRFIKTNVLKLETNE